MRGAVRGVVHGVVRSAVHGAVRDAVCGVLCGMVLCVVRDGKDSPIAAEHKLALSRLYNVLRGSTEHSASTERQTSARPLS